MMCLFHGPGGVVEYRTIPLMPNNPQKATPWEKLNSTKRFQLHVNGFIKKALHQGKRTFKGQDYLV